MMLPRIVIIGSINMDLVCRTSAMPRAGETVLGGDFLTIPGGKGANQAVAAAKLARDAQVHMVGRVGADDFGERLLNGLRQHHVNTDRVAISEGVASGVAMIMVDRKGENSIVVAPGANVKLAPADIDAAEGLIRSAAVVVMQLEIPLATVKHAIALCRRNKVFTILDPAPAPPKPLPRAFFQVDLLTPNLGEARMLLSRGASPRGPDDAKQLASRLIDRGAGAVAIKLGRRGAILATRGGQFRNARGFKVDVVDTTAAGDAFTGALAVAHAEEMELPDALRFANAAGAICCQQFGAQPALPARTSVDALLRQAR